MTHAVAETNTAGSVAAQEVARGAARDAAGLGIRILRALADAFGSLERAIRARNDIARLDALTDRQLDDIGLARGEIAREVLRRHFPEA